MHPNDYTQVRDISREGEGGLPMLKGRVLVGKILNNVLK